MEERLDTQNRSNQNAVKQSKPKEKIGKVVSTKMAKTAVVMVSRHKAHPRYKKIVVVRKKFYAHDEEGLAKEGDTVRIQECRPLSRLKRWKVVEVLKS
ncbi:30S ribosomal protein S17 [Methylacidiphilum caldifontis]|uniref:Small ribosomal subunit protein uS17 n=1 Tax=Methylacidiphilum caldifontis TaxID=2795386 RepID=A0A4Y8P6F9_9BACT|nr:30S ribosomal protein S17 [Methylacidiphilum caldifontis]QSR89312.1 30S ribosomal protein S17 [Methylacidiphilum caldifontis]TFE65708.1 30S ribosomal protein S17 [Methylacidiphilum caldifontis]